MSQLFEEMQLLFDKKMLQTIEPYESNVPHDQMETKSDIVSDIVSDTVTINNLETKNELVKEIIQDSLAKLYTTIDLLHWNFIINDDNKSEIKKQIESLLVNIINKNNNTNQILIDTNDTIVKLPKYFSQHSPVLMAWMESRKETDSFKIDVSSNAVYLLYNMLYHSIKLKKQLKTPVFDTIYGKIMNRVFCDEIAHLVEYLMIGGKCHEDNDKVTIHTNGSPMEFTKSKITFDFMCFTNVKHFYCSQEERVGFCCIDDTNEKYIVDNLVCTLSNIKVVIESKSLVKTLKYCAKKLGMDFRIFVENCGMAFSERNTDKLMIRFSPETIIQQDPVIKEVTFKYISYLLQNIIRNNLILFFDNFNFGIYELTSMISQLSQYNKFTA